jgi:hypothetical protein
MLIIILIQDAKKTVHKSAGTKKLSRS